MKRIAVFTSGGDSPGMNACIRAVVRSASSFNVSVTGIMQGYEGMIEGGENFVPIDARSVGNIIQRGGTILKSSRSTEFKTKDGRRKAYENLVNNGIEGIICIGGNGTFTGAEKFFDEYGIPSIGVPGTIDNDLAGTDYTIGFDTAVNTALEAIDRIRDTADSHGRVFFVEVMGRDTGFIALEVAVAAGAEMVLLPEVKEDPAQLVEFFKNREQGKKSFSIVVVAEGNCEGGATAIANLLNNAITGFESRVVILGHIQRGGTPSALDRILASQLGYSAVKALLNGDKNKMVGIIKNEVVLTSYKEAIAMDKPLNPLMLEMISCLNN